MRKSFILLVMGVVMALNAVSAQPCTETTTLILVRHAEKALDQGSDPSLSESGNVRAATLVQVLGDMPIAALYASQYKRTQETLQPLADHKSLSVITRPIQGKLEDFANALYGEIGREYCGKVVVIAGHSNTVPALLQTWCKQNVTIQDSVYNQLFVATLKNDSCGLIRAKYGAEN